MGPGPGRRKLARGRCLGLPRAVGARRCQCIAWRLRPAPMRHTRVDPTLSLSSADTRLSRTPQRGHRLLSSLVLLSPRDLGRLVLREPYLLLEGTSRLAAKVRPRAHGGNLQLRKAGVSTLYTGQIELSGANRTSTRAWRAHMTSKFA